MKDKKDQASRFAEGVLEGTREYVRELLDETNRLRSLVASLEVERSRLVEEKLRAQERLLEAREQLESYHAEQAELQRRLKAIERENEDFTEQYVLVEQQNANLANLYVTAYRLHGTLDLDEILSAILEIIINLVGSEEVAVLDAGADADTAQVLAVMGLPFTAGSRIPIENARIREALRTGETYAASGPVRSADGLTACIPLSVDGRVIGAVVVFGLLEQKKELASVDLELFGLLGTHAGVALHCARLDALARAEREEVG